ncbi:MAG: FAD-dependent pyridine nucleotide-disulfide oxidoreductase [Solirubrobacterales bacterium]|nr:FAD-dependent pyridine nucleotide-disulfide oxidoreductase [Solirubrobacterales bacterium]
MTPAIVIVGAGFGGLAVALELKRSGHDDFVILERQDRVGGVWCANTYPGAACDVPSEIYSFARALKPDWSRRFGSQPEIQRYLADVAREHDLERHLRFGVEVQAATWREASAGWELATADGQLLHADVLVCATGQLSRPKVPDVPGRERFGGAQFHSARWDHDVDLRGKRVAVVGGGASAVQVVPAIVDAAAHVTVVQRSPSWVVPKYDWAQSRAEHLLMRLPGIARLRHNLMWWKFEANVPIISRRFDPPRKLIEARLRRLIRRKVGDAALARAVTPTYPFGCNRVLLSSNWYPTLAREDVDVVAAGLAAVDRDGLSTDDGRRVPADVIIWCTGFTPTEYLAPMRITGRDGADLRERWRDGPEAYLGLVTHGFPNLFMSYGPNTGSLTNTIIFLLERQATYIRQAIEHIMAAGGSLDVRTEVHVRFNRELQDRLQRTVFTAGCPGWYATADGKVTTVWPGSHVAYALATREFDPGVYAHRPAPGAPDPVPAHEAFA